MKKIILSLLIACGCIFVLNQPIHAEEYYFVEIIENVEEDTSTQTRSTTTTTKKKTVYCQDTSENNLWSITVTGTFTYNGSTSSCTKSSVSSKVYDDAWKITNTSSSKSGSTASASGTGKKYLAFVVTATIDKTVKLTCDKNGNFS